MVAQYYRTTWIYLTICRVPKRYVSTRKRLPRQRRQPVTIGMALVPMRTNAVTVISGISRVARYEQYNV